MGEQIRIGDIVVELRASYEAGEGCRVCLDSARLTATGQKGKPDSATIAMTVHLERPTSPFDKDVVSPPRETDVDHLEELDEVDRRSDAAEIFAPEDDGPEAGRGNS
jgi:hypothetical protein